MVRKFVNYLVVVFVLQSCLLFSFEFLDIVFVLTVALTVLTLYLLVPKTSTVLEECSTLIEQRVVLSVFFGLAAYVIWWITENRNVVGMLNSHTDVGLVHKCAGVFLPGLLAYSRLVKMRFWRIMELVTWIIVLSMALITLSKHYIVSLIWVYLVSVRRFNWRILFGMSAVILVLISVYSQRGATNINDTISLLIMRFPIYFEGKTALAYYLENGIMMNYDPWKMSAPITELVFQRNPKYMGWAPGLIGIYFLYTGFAVLFLLPLSLRGLHFILEGITRVKYLSVLAVIVFFDLISSLTDGLPHILTSVNKGRVFYGYIMIFLIVLVVNSVFPKSKNIQTK